MFAAAAAAGDEIAQAYEECDFNRAVRLIVELADRANPFVEQAEPWKLAKDPSQSQRLQNVCTIALNLYRQIVIYLAPMLPELARRSERLLGTSIHQWDAAKTPAVGVPIAEFEHLMKRVDPKDIQAMIEESRQTEATPAATPAPQVDGPEALLAEPLAETCSIEDFAKVDLRVARVLAAESVPEANKLLKLTLSLGGDQTRQVFAGIKAAYEPEALVGRLVVMVANLAPRKMRFGVSEGMVTAAGSGGTEVFLLAVDSGAKPGMRVH